MMPRQSLPKTLVLLVLALLGVANAMSVKFQKSNWNEYKIGDSPDVQKDFSAPWDGCTGFKLGGKPCNPSAGDHGKVSDSPNGSGSVMKVRYVKGKVGSASGGQFYKDISGLGNTVQLDYQVYIPSNFDFRRGGKLPGLYGGNKQCSGSKVLPNGKNCFSTRLMWREDGVGEVYMYLPFKLNQDSFCKQCSYPVTSGKCSSLSGAEYCAWSRGTFRFKRGAWNNVRQIVKLNTAGKQDGSFELFFNGNKVAAHSGVVYRSDANMKIGGMLFSTFFGGSGSAYAPKSDQELFFRNIKISG